MNRALLERLLLAFGALLLALFVLSFALSALDPWQDEIRLLTVGGVALYAIYNFWAQQRDGQEFDSKADEATRYQNEAAQLRARIRQLETELQEAREAQNPREQPSGRGTKKPAALAAGLPTV